MGYKYAELEAMLRRYDPGKLEQGYNRVDGEDVFYISNPALGLWAERGRFVK